MILSSTILSSTILSSTILSSTILNCTVTNVFYGLSDCKVIIILVMLNNKMLSEVNKQLLLIKYSNIFTNSDVLNIIQTSLQIFSTMTDRDPFTNDNLLQLVTKHILDCEKVDSRPHCFWSGIAAKKYVLANTHIRTDYDYQIINLLFELCEMIRADNGDQHSKQMTLVSYAISGCYTHLCTGTVHLYLSSDKQSEPVGLTVNNNFWCGELPILQQLRMKGIVDNIVVHLHHDVDVDVDPNVDINVDPTFDYDHNQCVSFGFDQLDVPVWRRSWHPLDSMDHKLSFVVQGMTDDQYEEWRMLRPRPYILLSSLRRIAKRWIQKLRK
jgi:hypothetical protein